jgi:hypothetical protein
VTTLASGQNHPFAVAADSANIYWAFWGGTNRIDKNGGAITLITQWSGLFIVDSGNIFIDGGGTIAKVSVNGGNASFLSNIFNSQDTTPSNITVDSANVYWINQSGLHKVSTNGTESMKICSASLSYGFPAIAGDSTSVYWIDNSDHTIKKVAKTPVD